MVSVDREGPKSGFNWARIAINQLMDRKDIKIACVNGKTVQIRTQHVMWESSWIILNEGPHLS